MKKFMKILFVLIVLAVLVLFLLNKFGFGFGNGFGLGFGDRIQNSDQSADADDSNNETRGGISSRELPSLITVTIREDKVYVEDKEIGDEAELKDYIESINTDDREYRLVDENSIRATYEWVMKVFDELKIPISAE